MSCVSKHAAFNVGTGNCGEAKGAGKTLVTLGVVVLESDLDLDRLSKVPLLPFHLFGTLGDGFTACKRKDVSDALLKECGVQLVGHDRKICRKRKILKLLPSNDGSRIISIHINMEEN